MARLSLASGNTPTSAWLPMTISWKQSGEFVERKMAEAEQGMKEALGWRGRIPDLESLLRKISKKEGVDGEKVRGGGRKRAEVRVRKIFCRVAAKKYAYSGARISRFLGVTASSGNR